MSSFSHIEWEEEDWKASSLRNYTLLYLEEKNSQLCLVALYVFISWGSYVLSVPYQLLQVIYLSSWSWRLTL